MDQCSQQRHQDYCEPHTHTHRSIVDPVRPLVVCRSVFSLGLQQMESYTSGHCDKDQCRRSSKDTTALKPPAAAVVCVCAHFHLFKLPASL